jgi:hypothetical protein
LQALGFSKPDPLARGCVEAPLSGKVHGLLPECASFATSDSSTKTGHYLEAGHVREIHEPAHTKHY